MISEQVSRSFSWQTKRSSKGSLESETQNPTDDLQKSNFSKRGSTLEDTPAGMDRAGSDRNCCSMETDAVSRLALKGDARLCLVKILKFLCLSHASHFLQALSSPLKAFDPPFHAFLPFKEEDTSPVKCLQILAEQPA